MNPITIRNPAGTDPAAKREARGAAGGLSVKICGLSTPETMEAALAGGADMVGLVFHPKSPRNVSLDGAAALAGQARGRALVVALTVDADDAALDAIMQAVGPDLIQCHGREDEDRLDRILALTGRPIMKAVGVADAADLAAVARFAPHAGRILLDAKPPAGAAYPGGHGQPFDWDILSALGPGEPFMLSGGLNPDNVAEAMGRIRRMGLALAGVDVSSGVETAPGCKDAAKIAQFIKAARAAA
jgi:phosphoribosylanthranilate isomerase